MNAIRRINLPRIQTASGLFRLFRLFRQSCMLCLLGIASSWSLSAATTSDLYFTSINGGTEYAVSARDVSSISGSVSIPATYNGKPVTEIANFGFGSFSYACRISSVTIPSSLKVIGEYAFLNCRSLMTINFALDSQLSTIKANAFDYCFTLYGITFPDSLTSLGANAFKNCSFLNWVDFSQTQLTSIENNTFDFCYSLTSVILPDTLTTIKESAFTNCSSLDSINFPPSLSSIEKYAFSDTAVTLVDLSQTAITSIGESAFAHCARIYSIQLPKTLSTLGADAFLNNFQLSYMTLHSEAPSLGAGALTNVGKDVSGGTTYTIYEGYEESYRNTWGTSYNYSIVAGPPDPPEPPVDPSTLFVETLFDPSNNSFSIITNDEGADSPLILQHASSLSADWQDVESNTVTQSTDSDTGTTTRTLSLDLDATASGYYRLTAPNNP